MGGGGEKRKRGVILSRVFPNRNKKITVFLINLFFEELKQPILSSWFITHPATALYESEKADYFKISRERKLVRLSKAPR